MGPAITAVAATLLTQALGSADRLPYQIERRDVWIDGGTCHVSYTLRWCGPEPVTLTSEELRISYRAVLSNAACPAHVVPVLVQAQLDVRSQPSVTVTVRDHRSEKDRCRERVSARIGRAAGNLASPEKVGSLVVEPQEQLTLELSFEHVHFLYGPHDPLLGERELTVEWGPIRLEEAVRFKPADQLRRAKPLALEPSRARQDPEYYCSRPGSLYLAADVPGYQYYRFEDVEVRYGSEWLLRFRYTIARGTQAECRVRVVEYQESPRYWRRLGGGFDERLKHGPQWQLFERRFRVGPETTAIAIDFRLTGSDVGEMWVDDVELVPVAHQPGGP